MFWYFSAADPPPPIGDTLESSVSTVSPAISDSLHLGRMRISQTFLTPLFMLSQRFFEEGAVLTSLPSTKRVSDFFQLKYLWLVPLLQRIFLLTIWKIHIMNSEHPYFPVLSGPPSSNLCGSFSRWSMVKLPVAFPSRESEFFPILPLLVAICCEELHFSTFITNFKSSL